MISFQINERERELVLNNYDGGDGGGGGGPIEVLKKVARLLSRLASDSLRASKRESELSNWLT